MSAFAKMILFLTINLTPAQMQEFDCTNKTEDSAPIIWDSRSCGNGKGEIHWITFNHLDENGMVFER